MTDDLISREDAIKAIDELSQEPYYQHEGEDWCVGAISARLKIEDVPSADRPQLDKDIVEPIGNGNVIMSEDTYEELLVDRPQGEWIADENGGYRCSVCGVREERFIYGLGEYWHGRGESNFCPNCGAKMKGADDEQYRFTI